MAKSTKGGLGRGLDALLGSYEDTVKTAPAPTPAARPAQIPAPSQRRLKEEEVLEREEINETYPEDNIHIKGVVQRRAAVQAPTPAAANEVVSHEPSSRVVEKVSNEVPIDSVRPNPDQPRTQFKKEELQELSSSIAAHGLLQPILVRKTGADAYEIIAGERRWQACKMAGLKKIPICIKEADDDNSLELALIENIQRSNLNPIEEAYGYRRLMERRNMTQSEVAQVMSKGRSTVANALRLLDLPERAQQLLFEEKITAGHARAILSIPSKEGREKLTQKLVDEKLSVRETEAIARLLSGKKDSAESTPRTPTPAAFKSVAKSLRRAFGTNVRVKTVKGKNKIEIEFKDEEDLERIFKEMTSSHDM